MAAELLLRYTYGFSQEIYQQMVMVHEERKLIKVFLNCNHFRGWITKSKQHEVVILNCKKVAYLIIFWKPLVTVLVFKNSCGQKVNGDKRLSICWKGSPTESEQEWEPIQIKINGSAPPLTSLNAMVNCTQTITQTMYTYFRNEVLKVNQLGTKHL